MRPHAFSRGFTLIELSIVLVIIGLLIASVLVGKSMIKQAKLLGVISDESRYVSAAKAFRDKYNALPGDMSNATSYWATNTTGAGCPPTTSYTTPQTATCNGDGSGIINNDGTSTTTSSITLYENFLAWQHLADAGFIPGSYTGAPGSSGYSDNEPGVNVPGARLYNSGFEWAAFNASSLYSPSAFFNITYYQQYLIFGAKSGSDLLAPVLTPSDALSLDAKIDDGKPGTGTLTTINGSTVLLGYSNYAYCVTSSNANTATYMTATTTPACILLFMVQW